MSFLFTSAVPTTHVKERHEFAERLLESGFDLSSAAKVFEVPKQSTWSLSLVDTVLIQVLLEALHYSKEDDFDGF